MTFKIILNIRKGAVVTLCIKERIFAIENFRKKTLYAHILSDLINVLGTLDIRRVRSKNADPRIRLQSFTNI